MLAAAGQSILQAGVKMMKQRTGMIAGSLLVAVLTLGSAPAMTAESGSNAGGNTGQSSQQKISDAKLEQFADAFMEIRSVRAEYAPKMQNTENKEERAKLMKEGQGAMKEAIRSSGMNVAEYKQIGRQLNQDKQLQQRLRQIMKEEMQGQRQGQGQSGSN
jgi:hypothetical protein